MARAFSTNHFPAFHSNLFVFEKKTKRISIAIGAKTSTFGNSSNFWAFFLKLRIKALSFKFSKTLLV